MKRKILEASVNEIKRISRKLTYDCLVDICDSKISVTVLEKRSRNESGIKESTREYSQLAY